MDLLDSSLDAFKMSLIKAQMLKLDKDLATQVAFSALSCNTSFMFKKVQLMAHLQMARFIEENKNASPEQIQEFENASHDMLPQTYLDRSEKPQ